MRTLLEIIVVALLIALAWETSFKDRLREVPWIGDKITTSEKPTRSAKRAHPLPSASPSGAWMLDPNRRSPLDTPVPQSQEAHPAPAASGSWMWDPAHRSPLDPPPKKQSKPTPR